MKSIMTGNLIIVVVLVTALYLNPALIGISFSTTEPSEGVDESITEMFKDAVENQTNAQENENGSSSQENNQQGNFCLKGTGPGTENPCLPCTPATGSSPGESECHVLPEGETMSNETKVPSSDPQTTSNNPKLPSSLSNWFSSGIQELEREKTIPLGTGKALQAFQQSNSNEMLKICKAISKDPTADIKLADCNSLQAGGEKAEELRWIIAGWTAGKLIESAEENNTSADTP
jgi:hypothetical protein